jgi:hypothetical protein
MRLAAAAAVLAWPVAATAQAYRLRADALASLQPPAGLVVLDGSGDPATWAHAQAVVWTGAEASPGDDSGPGDALVAVVDLRDPGGRGDVRVGRFVVSTGAVRPVHVDGASGRARLPAGFGLELFGGLPVVPSFGARAYDWLAGGRVSQRPSDAIVTGISYLHERDHGRRSDEEIGVDVGATPMPWLDLASVASWDLLSPGIAEARLSASARSDAVGVEAFAIRRSPARILPATSIWSALGDVPSDQLGLDAIWHAFPRLDLGVSPSVRVVDRAGLDATARAVLRLDDAGAGAIVVEARRVDADGTAWSGARTALRFPLVAALFGSLELEATFPDEPRGRGVVWPWGLVALAWRPAETWEAAAAVEASASPDEVRNVTALARLSTRFEGP